MLEARVLTSRLIAAIVSEYAIGELDMKDFSVILGPKDVLPDENGDLRR